MKIEISNRIWQKASWQRTAGAAAFAVLLAIGISGCKGDDKAPIVSGANPSGPDPADTNMASANGAAGQPTYVAGTSQAYTPQQSSESYPAGKQAPAPIVRGSNNAYLNESQNPNAAAPDYAQQGYADTQQAYDQGSNGQYDTIPDAEQPPPQLAEYEQPPAPADNNLWTPGYWSYANTGYYWVPGAWVSAPYVGALWTPGYWGAYGNRYRYHRGYWGRHVGYYGGINYGWGYVGTGYYGGYWNSNRFYYNRSITRVSSRVVTVYERPVVVNNIRYNGISNNRVSYNGGRGGINYQPRAFEVAAMREQHTGPLPEQRQFHQQAQMNRANFYNENHGRPAQVVLAQPIAVRGFTGPAASGNPREVNRGGFGRGAQPGQNQGFGQNNAQQQQRLQVEQQRNMQMQQHNEQMQQHNDQQQQRTMQQQQHNVQVEQQRNLQMQQTQQRNNMQEQQRNLQVQQEQQRNNAAQQERNLQQQQRNQAEQQRNLQQQQHKEIEGQRNIEMQQRNNNNAQLQQQRANETVQRNALNQQRTQQMEQQRGQQMEQQRNQQSEQQRSQQVEQQRNAMQQQRNVEAQQRNNEVQQRNAEQSQRNAQMQQQRNVQVPQAQPRVERHMEQPHVQAQPQPQHVEQPRAQVEQHSAPAGQPGGGGGHPEGGGGHPGGGGGHPGH